MSSTINQANFQILNSDYMTCICHRSLVEKSLTSLVSLVQKWSMTTVIYCRQRISRQLFSVIEAGVMESPSTTVFENCRNRLFYDMK